MTSLFIVKLAVLVESAAQSFWVNIKQKYSSTFEVSIIPGNSKDPRMKLVKSILGYFDTYFNTVLFHI